MTQHEKIANLLETVTLRCFASMFNPNAPAITDLVGKDPVTREPVQYTPWRSEEIYDESKENK